MIQRLKAFRLSVRSRMYQVMNQNQCDSVFISKGFQGPHNLIILLICISSAGRNPTHLLKRIHDNQPCFWRLPHPGLVMEKPSPLLTNFRVLPLLCFCSFLLMQKPTLRCLKSGFFDRLWRGMVPLHFFHQ